MNTRKNTLLYAAGVSFVALVLLALRYNVHSDKASADEVVPMQASIGGDSTDAKSPQLEEGKNLVSNAVTARATYLVGIARQQENAVQWLDSHRGNTLGQLSAASRQRGDVWTGEASDNSQADLIFETMAVELAMHWLQGGEYSPLESYSMNPYLMAAKLAGDADSYDPAATAIYLAALSLEGVADAGN